MVIHEQATLNDHVKFVSYTGKYPNLCSGTLTLLIDGAEYRFGDGCGFSEPASEYKKFWTSGGRCGRTSHDYGEWIIDAALLPSKFRQYASEIDLVFNANVEKGCCGGCQ